MNTLCIIPARGGSKRIPRKNIRKFCGAPMIAHSIKGAQASGAFDRILVSTDDLDIAEVSRSLGVEVPFMRSAEFCDDHTPLLPVVRHVLQQAETHYACQFDNVCCLLATAPLIDPETLAKGLTVLRDRPEARFAISVCSFNFPVQRSVKVGNDGFLEMLWPEHEKTRSQDLETIWHDAGQFYWASRSTWMQSESIFQDHCLPIPIPSYRVQDIDTEEDWIRAEALWRAHQSMTQTQEGVMG